MKNVTAITLCALLLAGLTLKAAPPKGWFMAGSKPASYDSGVDPMAIMNGLPSAFMKSNQPVPDGFGTLMQDLRPPNTSANGFASPHS